MVMMLFCPTEVFPEDSGNYTMTVKNQWGNASTMASLQVKGNSSFLERLLIIIIKGISRELFCHTRWEYRALYNNTNNTHACMQRHVCAHIHTCTCTRTHTCTHTYACTHTHTHAHTR